MRQSKRTKKQYLHLYDNPGAIVAGNVEHGPAQVILFPNGQKELWIKGPNGYGFKLEVSVGPQGISAHMSAFTGTPGLTVSGNADPDCKPVHLEETVRYMSVCQYFSTPEAAAFRDWYLHSGKYPQKQTAGIVAPTPAEKGA